MFHRWYDKVVGMLKHWFWEMKVGCAHVAVSLNEFDFRMGSMV